MLPKRLRALHGEALTPKKSQTSQGYRFTLSRPGGLACLGIRAYSVSEPQDNGVRKTNYLGNPGEDGRFHFPLSFHGKCFLDGDMLAEAMLKVAAENSNLKVSLSGRTLSFSCNRTIPLLPTGLLRDGTGVIYTVMFRMRAPGFSGTSLRSGLTIGYDGSTQAISMSGSFTGEETVQFLVNSSSTKRITGISVSTTSGQTRELDLDSFGVFFGTVSEEDHEPYHGIDTPFSLAAPLRSKDTYADIAYPLQGYAERWVLSRPFRPQSATAVDLGSSFPTYRIELDEDLQGKAVSLNCFSYLTNESTFLQYSMSMMYSEDGKALLFTASASQNTPEAFLALFESLEAEVLWLSETPVIEHFPPIRPQLAAEEVFLTLKTTVKPNIMYFTYV